jgi:hypothetical protein
LATTTTRKRRTKTTPFGVPFKRETTSKHSVFLKEMTDR